MPDDFFRIQDKGRINVFPIKLVDNGDGTFSIGSKVVGGPSGQSSSMVVETVRVTTTGTAGAATGSANSNPMYGLLVGVNIDYHASAPATTDVTLTDVPSGTAIAVFSNSKTDVVHLPLKQNVDAAGAAISGMYSNFPLTGQVAVSVAQADALTNCVVVRLIYLAV